MKNTMRLLTVIIMFLMNSLLMTSPVQVHPLSHDSQGSYFTFVELQVSEAFVSNSGTEEAYVPVAATPYVASLQATTAISQNVELVGQIGGEMLAVAVQGNYAYIGVGPRLG